MIVPDKDSKVMLLNCKHELETLKLKHKQMKEEFEAKLIIMKQENKQLQIVLKECKQKLGDSFKQVLTLDVSK